MITPPWMDIARLKPGPQNRRLQLARPTRFQFGAKVRINVIQDVKVEDDWTPFLQFARRELSASIHAAVSVLSRPQRSVSGRSAPNAVPYSCDLAIQALPFFLCLRHHSVESSQC